MSFILSLLSICLGFNLHNFFTFILKKIWNKKLWNVFLGDIFFSSQLKDFYQYLESFHARYTCLVVKKTSLKLLPGHIFIDTFLCFYPKLKISSINNHKNWNKGQNFKTVFYIQNRGKIYMWTSTSDNQELGTQD